MREIVYAEFTDSIQTIKKKRFELACMYISKAYLFAKNQPDLFEMRADVLSRTQYKGLLYQPRCRSATYRKNCYLYCYTCVVLYNELPEELKSLQ